MFPSHVIIIHLCHSGGSQSVDACGQRVVHAFGRAATRAAVLPQRVQAVPDQPGALHPRRRCGHGHRTCASQVTYRRVKTAVKNPPPFLQTPLGYSLVDVIVTKESHFRLCLGDAVVFNVRICTRVCRGDSLYANPKLSQSTEGVSPRRRTTSTGCSLDDPPDLNADNIVLRFLLVYLRHFLDATTR